MTLLSKGPAIPYANQYQGVSNTTGIAANVNDQIQEQFVAPQTFVCNHVLRPYASY